jgi:hypothetical protein
MTSWATEESGFHSRWRGNIVLLYRKEALKSAKVKTLKCEWTRHRFIEDPVRVLCSFGVFINSWIVNKTFV